MDGKFAKLSPFQVDPDKIPPLSAEDFAPAAEEEKAAMVEKHKSVSYWRDAWRRTPCRWWRWRSSRCACSSPFSARS